MPPMGLDLAMYLMEGVGKVREVRNGVWFFLDAWPRALGWDVRKE